MSINISVTMSLVLQRILFYVVSDKGNLSMTYLNNGTVGIDMYINVFINLHFILI